LETKITMNIISNNKKELKYFAEQPTEGKKTIPSIPLHISGRFFIIHIAAGNKINRAFKARIS
jgi:hypothetical protein